MIDIKKNVPLSQYTTFRIGGPAKYFVEIKNQEELMEALNFSKKENLDFFILGGGSNLLVSDDGFSGLVIKMRNSECRFEGNSVECGAGMPLSGLVKQSIEKGLEGLEWAAGIPGTVGGAVRGNAGAFGKSMQDVVEKVKIITEKGELKILDWDRCEFSYRGSGFKKNSKLVIFSVFIKLNAGDSESLKEKTKEIIAKRIMKQPKGFSAGSFFINPVVPSVDLIKEFEEENNTKSKENKVPAGWLIERVGIKGKKIGGAQLSETHANYIMNTGQASAQDVIILASLIKQKVRDELGVELHEEVEYLGF